MANPYALYGALKPLLFRLDAEQAHNLTFRLLEQMGSLVPGSPLLGQRIAQRHLFGLDFPNPVGLAAGLDKNARLLSTWQRIGFGYVEIGTVTPKPQPGNPRPRLFRLTKDSALLNRMGFNNEGAMAVARRLEKRPAGLLVGANLGKNKDTPLEDAASDYQKAFVTLQGLADYFVINVSSPNTPGLRELQEKDALQRIIGAVQEVNQGRAKPHPILLKVAPELTPEQLDDVIAVAHATHLAGFIATNTWAPSQESLSRMQTPAETISALGAGGLSGPFLIARSVPVVKHLVQSGLPIIGVGGIQDAEAATRLLDAGASLVQFYTGLIYKGPALVTEILRSLQDQQKS